MAARKLIYMIAGVVLVSVIVALAIWQPWNSAPRVLPAERLVPKIILCTYTAGASPERYEGALLIISKLEDLGISAELKAFSDTASITGYIGNPPYDWDLYFGGFVGRPERMDPDTLLSRMFLSSQAVAGGSNYGGYNNSEYDQLIAAERAETNITRRQQLVYQLQAIVERDVPIATVYHNIGNYAVNNQTFKGYVNMMGRGTWNIWSMVAAQPLTSNTVMKIGSLIDLDSLNPLIEQHEGIDILKDWIYDTLVKIGTDGGIAPWAAESWGQPDSKTYTIKLRAGMNFSDGQPVTAADVKFSYDLFNKSQYPIYTSYLNQIASVEVVDQLTATIKMKSTYTAAPYTLFSAIPILPMHIWQDVDAKNWPNSNPIGSGPFTFEFWNKGRELRVSTNDQHFSNPKVGGLTHIVYANYETLFMDLTAGNLDCIIDPLTGSYVNEAKKSSKLMVLQAPDFAIYPIFFDLRRAPGNDLNFRRAVAYAIPYEDIINDLLDGYAVIGQGVIAPCLEFWHNKDLKFYDYNMTKAREFLAKAGYEWDTEGRLYYPPS